MKHKHHVNSYIAYSLISLSVLSTIMLSSSLSSVSAESVPASVTITASCTITTTGSTTHSATIIPGNYTEIISNAIDVSCNDAGGYAIYAIGFGGDSYTASNRNKLISSLNSSYDIITNNTGSASYWAMKVTPSGTNAPTVDNSYNIYQQIPDTFTEISHYTSSTLGTNNSVTTPTYKVNISANQPAGSYTGKVKYVLTHPNTATPANNMFTVVYNSNGGTGSMTSSSFYTFDDNILTTNSFTAPTGYTFKNWCTVQDQTQNPQTTCTGDTYTDGETILAGDISAGTTLNLYAVWESSTIYMQDMTDAQCQQNVGTNGNATNIGDNITVYDKRATSGNNNYSSGDDGDYTVRWINGACWMTQNLRIQGTVSATDSNFDSGSVNVSQYDLKTNGSNECGSTDGYNNPCSRVPDSTDMSTIGSGVTAKEVGAWYNYYATTAGTISTNSNSTEATSDICPSGWHLPTGAANNTSSEFYKLFQSTSTNWINPNDYLTAFGAVKGGAYSNGSLLSVTYGDWWSATAGSTTGRYNLNYNSSNGQFYSSLSVRYFGYFVRCIKSS